jgi:hypothetical protein
MTQDEVQQTAERLQQAGEAVSVRAVREALGYGSFRDIAQHLRTLEGEGLRVAVEPVGDEEGDIDGSPQNEETAVALLTADDEAVDMVQAAEGALQRAKERLAQAETRVPELERQVAELREMLLQATLQHLTIAYAASKGLLSISDPGVSDAEKAMWEAGRAHRQAKERLDQAPQAIAAARGAVRIATQQIYLAREHPELVQALTEAEGLRPSEDRGPDTYRQWALWRQEVSSVRARVDDVIAQAGL